MVQLPSNSHNTITDPRLRNALRGAKESDRIEAIITFNEGVDVAALAKQHTKLTFGRVSGPMRTVAGSAQDMVDFFDSANVRESVYTADWADTPIRTAETSDMGRGG